MTVRLHLARGRIRHSAGWVAHFLVIATDLADNVVKGRVDVPARFGRCLDEFAAELAGECLALWTHVNINSVINQKN